MMRCGMTSGEENREQYEIPEVEKALPECIRKTLSGDDHDSFTRNARRVLRRHADGQYRSWIDRLRKSQQLSRVRLPTDVHGL